MDYFIVFNQLNNFAQSCVSGVLSFLYSNTSVLIVNSVLLYGKLSVIINNKKKELFNQYPIVEEVTKRVTYLIKYACNYYYDIRTEPYDNCWISTSALTENLKYYKMIETYEYKNKLVDKLVSDTTYAIFEIENKTITNSIKTSIENLRLLHNSLQEVKETMIILKNRNQRIVRTFHNPKDDIKPLIYEFPITKSSVKFLSIVYSNIFTMKDIEIKISDEYYLDGNQLFSALFIKRYLENHHCVQEYHFDENYKLSLMDDNIKYIELTSNQYIVLDKTKYQIVNIE